MWKRKNAELAYRWAVDDFEEREPNRPQFYGTKIQKVLVMSRIVPNPDNGYRIIRGAQKRISARIMDSTIRGTIREDIRQSG